MTTVLLTCGHESALRESAQPNALWFCETCQHWQERDESNGLCLEDLPPPFSAQYDLIGDAEKVQRADEARGRIPEDADFELGPEDAR